jgi:pantetheine-phosphate adenylyltransferase
MTALIPLSADPVSFGHLWLIEEAAKKWDKVIVFICNNGEKKHLFSIPERLGMLSHLLVSRETILKNVEIITSGSILPDVFMKRQCDVVVRGHRNEIDKKEDQISFQIHKIAFPKIEVEWLEPPDNLKILSSSLMKALVKHDMDISDLTSTLVKECLEKRIRGITKIGLVEGVNSDEVINSIKVGHGYDVNHNLPTKVISYKKLYSSLEDFALKLEEDIPFHFARKFREEIRGFSGTILFEDMPIEYAKFVNYNVVVPEKDFVATSAMLKGDIVKAGCGRVYAHTHPIRRLL